jgi:hypothetical protein
MTDKKETIDKGKDAKNSFKDLYGKFSKYRY